MPKKDTKKKPTKPRVLKQKQKQRQTQNVTINIKNGTTKAPRKTTPKPTTQTPKLYPQTYPVFMNYDIPPPSFYNTPKIEQTEPVKIFVSPKIETQPIKIQTPVAVPAVTPVTVKPKRKYTRKIPILDVIPPPMTTDISSIDGSPVKSKKSQMIAYPKVYSPAKSIEGITDPSYDSTYSKGTTVSTILNPMPRIVKKYKPNMYGEYPKSPKITIEGVDEMKKIGGVTFDRKKENSMSRANVSIRESLKNDR